MLGLDAGHHRCGVQPLQRHLGGTLDVVGFLLAQPQLAGGVLVAVEGHFEVQAALGDEVLTLT